MSNGSSRSDYHHAWYMAHRHALSLEERRQKRNERARRYRAHHREQMRAYANDWYAANGERVRAKSRAPAVVERRRRYMHDYFARPGVAGHYHNVRRSRLLAASGFHTNAEWLAKVALLGGCCIYCGRSDIRLSRDHKVPLCRGGSNDITNIVPACGRCNSVKGPQTASEFIQERLSRCTQQAPRSKRPVARARVTPP